MSSAPTVATAQPNQSADIQRFDPAPAGDRFFGVPSPFAAGRLTFHGGAVLDYAHDPLVLADADGDAFASIVEHQLLLHLNVAFSLFDRLQLNADMPFAIVNEGDGRVEAGAFQGARAFQSPGEAGVGDLRLGARVRLFGDYYGPFQIALGGYVWMPTATADDFLGTGTVRGQPQVIVGGRMGRFLYDAMIGASFRETRDYGALTLGHQFNWGVGVGVLLGAKHQVQLGLETTGAVTVADPQRRSTNAEALVGAKFRVASPIELGVAVGPGFTSGAGTPDFRSVLTVFYTPEVPRPTADRDVDGIIDTKDACPDVKGVAQDDPNKNGCPRIGDRDKDTILDDVDACPDEPGRPDPDLKKHGCPVDDTDGDGVLDDVDACVTVAGVKSDDPRKHGCPADIPDRDGDGVEDGADACIDVAGVRTTDPKTNGCPPDTDGDGFRDDVDACPREKGVDDPDRSKKGCPKLVRVVGEEIVILEQIQFDTSRATIKPVSDPILDAIAQVLRDHPEIVKLEVQGHTDSDGAAASNKVLSDERAAAVVKALVKRGVEAGRLEAKGYGQTAPIAPNDSSANKQKNRRVQFVVREKRGGANVITK